MSFLSKRHRAMVIQCLLLGSVIPAVSHAQSTIETSTRTVGVNLAPAKDYQSVWAFVDVVKTARPWLAQTTQAPGGPWDTGERLDLDENGWPASLAPGQAASTLMCREIDGRYPGGRYVCLYDGTGTIDFNFDAKIVSKAPGRLELDVTPSENGILMSIKATDPADPVRNIRVIMPGFEGTYETQIFHPTYLESLEPFSTIRFMDWGSTNNSRVTSWSDRTRPDHFSQQRSSGVSIEIMVELCNALNADGWFCVPHAADDNYVRQMARTIQSSLEPGRKAYIEYSNEVWNGGFRQYDYAAGKAAELGLSELTWIGVWRWTAQRSVEIFDIVDDFIPPNRLVRVLAGQAAVPDVLKEILNWKNAGAHADAIAIAPYFSGPAADPAYYPEMLSWSVDQILDGTLEHLVKVTDWIQTHSQLANKHGMDLLGYEGGQHLAPLGGTPSINDPVFQDLMAQANRHPRMREFYFRYLWAWHELGGGSMCLFNHISESTKWGNWGLLEYQDQPWSEAPKWHGVISYMLEFDAMNKGTKATVSADLDLDGVLTGNDIGLFVVLFIDRDPRADFNLDAVIDSADLVKFIETFLEE